MEEQYYYVDVTYRIKGSSQEDAWINLGERIPNNETARIEEMSEPIPVDQIEVIAKGDE